MTNASWGVPCPSCGHSLSITVALDAPPVPTTHVYVANRGDMPDELAAVEGDRCLDCGKPQRDGVHAVPGSEMVASADRGEPSSA